MYVICCVCVRIVCKYCCACVPCCACVYVCVYLAMRVDTSVDQTLQDELGEFVLQRRHCGVKRDRHLIHICRYVRTKVLHTHTNTHTTVITATCLHTFPLSLRLVVSTSPLCEVDVPV